MKVLQIKPVINLKIGDGGWRYKLPLVLLAIGCLFPLFSANPFSYEHSWLFNGFTQQWRPRTRKHLSYTWSRQG